MVNPIYILLLVVSLSVLVLLGINLYILVKSKKRGPDQDYVVMHQRLDAMSASQLNLQNSINDQLEKNRQSAMQATLSVHQQVQNFTQGMTQLHEGLKGMHDSVKSVVSFQDLFRNPKLRGQWGEMSLEASLAQYFPKDRYLIQHYFSSGEAVDAALRLPNEILLPIDSKFNWDNFQKLVNSDNDIHRDGYRKLFYSDVKKKVDEISSKYILPAEGTTDFALMFVPAETVYYEMINNVKDVDIADYARKRKVILVSPNTFALSVSAIQHWYRDVQINQKTQSIIKKLETIVADSAKLADNFRKLGSHLSNAQSAYEDSEKRLGLMTDRVSKVIRIGETEEKTEEIAAPSRGEPRPSDGREAPKV
ncbi:MAG: DNA recombination protein RmuC [Candidatus Yanofskybacteria bacterium]|nr:DNA recombination protein RmuC [Candidatus Yanofskybacteria bacterium]